MPDNTHVYKGEFGIALSVEAFDQQFRPLDPDFNSLTASHDWHDCISQEIKDEWDTFTVRQKRLLASNAQQQYDEIEDLKEALYCEQLGADW